MKPVGECGKKNFINQLHETYVLFCMTISPYPCRQCVLESQTSGDTSLALLVTELLAQHHHILFLWGWHRDREKNKNTGQQVKFLFHGDAA